MNRQTVSVTTDTSGDATAYSDTVNGRVLKIQYVKDDFVNGVDFTITTETTSQTLWNEDDVNASETVIPREGLYTTIGTQALYAAAGSQVHGQHIYAHYERIKIVIANGGASKSGTFYIFTDE